MGRVIYACDVGSVRAGTFAWARAVPDNGNPCASRDVEGLALRLVEDVNAKMSVALGFECPLFMPIPEHGHGLNRGREGEGNRSMFAPAGAAVATLGLQEVAWLLRQIRKRVDALPEYSLDWHAWPPPNGSAPSLLLWEAFVSGAAHSDSHEQDAATAAMFFSENELNLDMNNAVETHQPLSMVHAAALWAGWAHDRERLHHSCLVLKPKEPYRGQIDHA